MSLETSIQVTHLFMSRPADYRVVVLHVCLEGRYSVLAYRTDAAKPAKDWHATINDFVARDTGLSRADVDALLHWTADSSD